jgi:phosphatidylinositol-3-phosphatase
MARHARAEEAHRGAALIATLVAAAALGLAAPSAPPVPSFAHVFVVVFENREAGDVLGSGDAPTFDRLAQAGARLTHYDAVAHPSLPNYLALVSGSTHGIVDDCTDCVVRARSLADTLEASGRTWKTYAEGLPHRGFTGSSSGRYAKKHDPFLYFADVLASARRRDRVVPFAQLARDRRSGRLPDFALVVPDLCDDMHDCSTSTGDAWLRRQVEPLLSLPRTAVFVVFDEGSSDAGGGGHVAALVLGTAVRPGATYAQPTSHYGLLRTVEDAWRLPALGRSAAAGPITGIWR